MCLSAWGRSARPQVEALRWSKDKSRTVRVCCMENNRTNITELGNADKTLKITAKYECHQILKYAYRELTDGL
jgi:hypothetical protein